MTKIVRYTLQTGQTHFHALIHPTIALLLLSTLLVSVGHSTELVDSPSIEIGPDQNAKKQIRSSYTDTQKALMNDGKILIKHVKLNGDALYPAYGVTEDFVTECLQNAFNTMDPRMTISDMQFLADALTLAYHNKGFTFNQVFLVPKEIENDTLTLTVLPGKISEIAIKNNKIYSSEQIMKGFEHLLGKVVYEPQIADAMKLANQVPGLKIFGFFSIGQNPGQVRLNLHVLKEKAYFGSMRVDNYGVTNTGNYRMIGQFNQNNLSGNGDTLNSLIGMTEESGNLFGNLSYRYPYFEEGSISLSLYSNLFEVTGDFHGLGLSGHVEALAGLAETTLFQEQGALAGWSGHIELKNSEISSEEFKDVFAEKVHYVTLGIALEASVTGSAALQRKMLRMGVDAGHILSTNNSEYDPQFLIFNLYYGVVVNWNKAESNDWLTRFDGEIQYTPNTLPTSEQQIATGPYAVRSYEPALFSADSQLKLSLHQNLKTLSFSGNLYTQPFLFADFTTGKQNDQAEDSASFFGLGVGFDLLYQSVLNTRLTLGYPINESSNRALITTNPDWVIFGYLSYQF